MYTTILVKKDRDFSTGVKVASIAETSKANNAHQVSYPNQLGRSTIVTGVECMWQRLTAGMNLLLISEAFMDNVIETIFAS